MTVDVTDGVSVEYYPRGFRLYSDGDEIAFGSVMSAANFASMKETYDTPDDELTSTLEEKDGYYILTDSDPTFSVGYYVPINDDMYGMLHVESNMDTDYVWGLVSYSAVVDD